MAKRHVIKDVQAKGLDHNKPHSSMHKGTLSVEAKRAEAWAFFESFGDPGTSILASSTPIVETESVIIEPEAQAIKIEAPVIEVVPTTKIEKKQPPKPKKKD